MKNKKIKIYTYYNFLFWHYVVLGISPRKIGRMYGTNYNTIRNWLKKFNIKREKPLYENKKWIYNLYIELKKSTPEIGKICGVSHTTIKNWLIKFNISRRSNEEAQKIIWKRPEYKKKRSGENNPLYGRRENKHPKWKVWEELGTNPKHNRKRKELTKIGIFEPDYCPICDKKPKNKKEIHLMNINHKYLDNSLDWYYMCTKCHNKYHFLAGLKKK